MSLNEIKKEKENKLFKKGDIIVYSIIAILIIILFISIFLSRDNSKIKGIEVKVFDEVVFVYDFTLDKYEIKKEDIVSVEKENNKYFVTIKYKDEHNKFEININDRVVNMISADCSPSKDCCHMSIKTISDEIVCIPHRLIISPLGDSAIHDPVVG